MRHPLHRQAGNYARWKLLLLIAGLGGVAQAAGPPRLQELGRLGGTARVVVAAGDRAVVGMGATLLVADLEATPAAVRQSVPIGGDVRDVAVVGGVAWCVTGGVEVVGVDLERGTVVGRVSLPGEAGVIAAAGNLLLVGRVERELVVLRPRETARDAKKRTAQEQWHTGDGSGAQAGTTQAQWHAGTVAGAVLRGSPEDVGVRDGLVAVALGDDGVEFLTLGDDGALRPAARFHTKSAAEHVAVDHQRRAFVALRGGGVVVLDVRDPEAPRFVEQVQTTQPATDIVTCFGGVHVALGGEGLARIEPDAEGNWALGESHKLRGGARRLAATKDGLLVLSGGSSPSLRTLKNVGDGAITWFESSTLPLLGNAVSLAIVGERVYVADQSNAVKVVDIRDAERPQQVGVIEIAEPVLHVRAGHERLALIQSTGMVAFVDLKPSPLSGGTTGGSQGATALEQCLADDKTTADTAVAQGTSTLPPAPPWEGGGFGRLPPDRPGARRHRPRHQSLADRRQRARQSRS
jgi:hypothetical protein